MEDWCLLRVPYALLSSLPYTVQDHPPRGGTAHSVLGLPITIVNQENAYRQLMEECSQFPLLR